MALSLFQREVGDAVVVVASLVPLRSEPSDAAELVTQLLIGETAEVVARGDRDWLKVRGTHDGYEGWCDGKMLDDLVEPGTHLLRSAFSLWCWPDGSTRWLPAGGWLKEAQGKFWAPDGNEVVPIAAPIGEDWRAWLGAPYLWGGRTVAGVDCSGFMQVLARIERPEAFVDRDASDQIALGSVIAFADHQVGDWAFFSNPSGRIVHVGLIVAPNEIVHAAGQVRLDRLTDRGIERVLSDGTVLLTHTLAGIRRHSI